MTSPAHTAPSLSVHNLTVAYGEREVVRGVSFHVASGSILGLLGPSGAGKSSLLAALTGIVSARGTVHLGELDLTDAPARLRGFGHVYQEFRLFEWMSVWDNISFPCRAKGDSAAQTRTSVEHALRRVGLTVSHDKMVNALSGGERQRVALARALAANPNVLLLDEPFAHLDPPLREELKRDLQEMLRETSIPVVLVTHDCQEAFEVCDQIGVMIDGSLVQSGSARDLLHSPASLQVASLLGFSNSLTGIVRSTTGEVPQVLVEQLDATVSARSVGGVLHLNDRVRLVCRPGRVRLGDHGSKDLNQLKAVVTSVHSLSENTTLTIRLGSDILWSLRSPQGISTHIGELVQCIVASDDLMAYPITSS